MPQSAEPSYTEPLYATHQGAERPLTFQEVFDGVSRHRPITTRNPKATIRNALGQGSQLVSLGDGHYWYLPHCIHGSLLRVPLTEKRPANRPIALPDEVRHALWPSLFESQKRRTERPMVVQLPTGDEVPLTLGFVGGGAWGTPVVEPLRRYLVGHRAAAGDSLLIRVLDAQAGRGEAWFESQLRRPAEAIAARNQELADAAYAFMRQRATDDEAIWDIAIALLARGHYRSNVAPDDLKSVLRGDPRFESARRGGLLSAALGVESDPIVRIRELPGPATPQVPPTRRVSPAAAPAPGGREWRLAIPCVLLGDPGPVSPRT